jgi:3-hydroxyacyl-CoA dehydrogenase
MSQLEPIAVVGTGLIGRAWAIVFARAGHEVRLYDAQPAAIDPCMAFIQARLTDLREYGLLADAPTEVMARIRAVDTLAQALDGVALAQENIRETVQAKQAIYAQMDALAPPQAVLASSTSWIPASEFTADLKGRARCLVAHPTNPPYLVPLVELCPAPWTSTATMDRAHAIYAGAGQEPVRMTRELPGFLLNRVQAAVLNECFLLYQQGIASAADIDKVLKEGLALRWSFMGPFETIDLNAPAGVADYAERYGPSNQRVSRDFDTFDWNPETIAQIHNERREQLSLSDIEQRSAWRDRRLMALAAHKQRAARE